MLVLLLVRVPKPCPPRIIPHFSNHFGRFLSIEVFSCLCQVQWQKPIVAARKLSLTLTAQAGAPHGAAKWDGSFGPVPHLAPGAFECVKCSHAQLYLSWLLGRAGISFFKANKTKENVPAIIRFLLFVMDFALNEGLSVWLPGCPRCLATSPRGLTSSLCPCQLVSLVRLAVGISLRPLRI